MSARQAGAYAHQRYQAGLHSYRRRMRPYVLGLLGAAFLVLVVLGAVHGADEWSVAAGLVSGGLMAMAIWLHDEPPEFIAKWGRGSAGERKTGRSIAPLLKEGWKVRHDVELRYGNADHLLLNPKGTAFLLETKTLAGRISVEHGKLTCRFADDPEEVRRYDLRPRIDSLTREVSQQWRRRSKREAPEIQPVVVVWGNFHDRIIQDGGLAYVAGEALTDYLRKR